MSKRAILKVAFAGVIVFLYCNNFSRLLDMLSHKSVSVGNGSLAFAVCLALILGGGIVVNVADIFIGNVEVTDCRAINTLLLCFLQFNVFFVINLGIYVINLNQHLAEPNVFLSGKVEWFFDVPRYLLLVFFFVISGGIVIGLAAFIENKIRDARIKEYP